MSTPSEHSDSDSNNSSTSWIMVDEAVVEKQPDKESEDEVSVTYNYVYTPRKNIEEVHWLDESDGISVITDPEDAEEEVVANKMNTVAVVEKPVVSRSSLTSAAFMVIGLIIAIYFHYGSMDIITEQSCAPKTGVANYDVSRIQTNKYNMENGNKYKKYGKDEFRNYKKRFHDDNDDYKYAKPNFKEQTEYLNKKQQYLKYKEDKLNKKELKFNARNSKEQNKKRRGKFNSTGEWYNQMHDNRNVIRKDEHKSDWVFDRAQFRKKKRDKAHWYFQLMDNRETVRTKKITKY